MVLGAESGIPLSDSGGSSSALWSSKPMWGGQSSAGQGSCVSSSLGKKGREGRRSFAELAPDRTESFVEADALGAACLRLAWLRQERETAAIQIHTEERKVTAPYM